MNPMHFHADGAWRGHPPAGLTQAVRRILARLARGDALVIDPEGKVRLRDAGLDVTPAVLRQLIDPGLATRPLAELPLYSKPAEPGVITEAGLAALSNPQQGR